MSVAKPRPESVMHMAKKARREVSEELITIPGVGPRIANALAELGYVRVSQLCGADAERMYQRLCALRGERIDRCVLYTFRCAVYYASNPAHDPELLKWWNWKDSE
jgi:3-methyladenine DNA glycosylase/8-oxoguanine DNA glycosylase